QLVPGVERVVEAGQGHPGLGDDRPGGGRREPARGDHREGGGDEGGATFRHRDAHAHHRPLLPGCAWLVARVRLAGCQGAPGWLPGRGPGPRLSGTGTIVPVEGDGGRRGPSRRQLTWTTARASSSRYRRDSWWAPPLRRPRSKVRSPPAPAARACGTPSAQNRDASWTAATPR